MNEQARFRRGTRGVDSVDYLKLAAFSYLGFAPGDEGHWKYQIRVGKAASVSEEHWGLLALTKPST